MPWLGGHIVAPWPLGGWIIDGYWVPPVGLSSDLLGNLVVGDIGTIRRGELPILASPTGPWMGVHGGVYAGWTNIDPMRLDLRWVPRNTGELLIYNAFLSPFYSNEYDKQAFYDEIQMAVSGLLAAASVVSLYGSILYRSAAAVVVRPLRYGQLTVSEYFSARGSIEILQRGLSGNVYNLLAQELVPIEVIVEGELHIALVLPREAVRGLLDIGLIDPNVLPVEIIDVGRYSMIINTRSATTLIQAGIRSSDVVWSAPSQAGAYERMLERIARNKIPFGTRALRISGTTDVWVEIPSEWQTSPRPKLGSGR